MRQSEETVQDLVIAGHTIYAQQTSLALAKEVQGLRALFDEVSICCFCIMVVYWYAGVS